MTDIAVYLQAIAAIALTCLLGLAVSLSTFLVIGATSSVTYNGVLIRSAPILACQFRLLLRAERMPYMLISIIIERLMLCFQFSKRNVHTC